MNYKHLIINELCCIYQFKNFGMGFRAIIKDLHRNSDVTLADFLGIKELCPKI